MSDLTQPAILLIRSGRHQGRVFTLPDEDVVVGREESCRIRLSSSDVSRRHCVIRATADGIVVTDLGSRNGTQVNDVTITAPTRLSAGDELRIGPLLFQVPRPDGSSEDEIADWLSDPRIPNAAEETSGPGDTTIIPNRRDEQPTPPPVPPPAKERFETIAEEAADIIRRHHEMHKKSQS